MPTACLPRGTHGQAYKGGEVKGGLNSSINKKGG